MNSEEIDFALRTIILGGIYLLLQPPISRRWWVKPWLTNKRKEGNLQLMHMDFPLEDPASFQNFVRMNITTFHKLLSIVQADIEKKNTIMRESISAKDRLIITLRYLASGETYKSLMYSFRVGHATISQIVPEVCAAIYKNLKDEYLKVPSTSAEWLNIAKDFEEKWQFPNTLGALDGKHIIIQAPRAEGSTFYNYKGRHSIVLLALVDANYKFLYFDVGCNGRISDGGVFARSELAKAIERNSLNFPEEKPLPQRSKSVPYVIVADAAFPLRTNILKPFPFRNMTQPQRIFNYRLSRARRVVENAFGILTNRFRVLLNTINLSPEKAETITLACVALHNYLRVNCPTYDVRNENDIDRRYTFKFALSQQAINRSSTSALNIRQEYMEYVNGEGFVAWQNELE